MKTSVKRISIGVGHVGQSWLVAKCTGLYWLPLILSWLEVGLESCLELVKKLQFACWGSHIGESGVVHRFEFGKLRTLVYLHVLVEFKFLIEVPFLPCPLIRIEPGCTKFRPTHRVCFATFPLQLNIQGHTLQSCFEQT